MRIMHVCRNVERNVERYGKMLRLQDRFKDLKAPTQQKEKGFRTQTVSFWKRGAQILSSLSPKGNGAITSSEGTKVG